jgi:1-phosphatidylinositol phosphodiesterase
MASTLTLRNLTPNALELKVVERYAAVTPLPNPLHFFTDFAFSITQAVGLRIARPRGPVISTIAKNAQPFSQDEIDVRLGPFSTAVIDKALPGSSEVVRLTFALEDQQYQLNLPLLNTHTNELVPLSQDPRFKISAIYKPDGGFLTLFPSTSFSDWMSELKDTTPISALSIPGTHNSPTYHTALPSVRCQVVSPKAQLNNGVRFFDIRVQPESPNDPDKDGLILVHGVFPISLTGSKYLKGLISDIESFLTAHPQETVILSIKREGSGEHTDQQLSRIMREHYTTDPAKWWTDPRIPRLGEVRGKMVLLRRFALDDEGRKGHDGRGWAINAEHWTYNTTYDERGDITVQDLCELSDPKFIDNKIEVCCAQLGRAGGTTFDLQTDANVPPLHLNFLSASNLWSLGCWPEKVAARLNPAVLGHLCVKHVVESQEADWSTGIVICDWVGDWGDWDLVRVIIGMNSKLTVRQRV